MYDTRCIPALDDIRAGKDGKLSNTHGQDLRTLEDYSIEKRKIILQSYYKVSND